MARGVWAASLISAGIAVVITAKVVEKIMLADIDEQIQKELDASVEFLMRRLDNELEDKSPGEEIDEEERQEAHKRVFGSRYVEKPPLEQVAGKNERVRYDQVLTKEDYKPTPTQTKVVEEVTVLEDDAQAPARADLAELVVIPTAEFMENESGYMQMSLTYYSDGGVLDEQSELVDDYRDMIGAGMPPFGELSGERHIVYLRNNKHRQEYEVAYDPGKAADILADPADSP